MKFEHKIIDMVNRDFKCNFTMITLVRMIKFMNLLKIVIFWVFKLYNNKQELHKDDNNLNEVLDKVW